MDVNSSGQSKSVQAIKLGFILFFLPVLAGLLKGLVSQIATLEAVFSKSLYWGIASYVLFHIFFVEPLKFYKKTQRFIQIIFGFFFPLFRLSYYVLPFWIIVLIGFYILVCKIFNLTKLVPLFFFLSGFLFTMHIILVAKILKVDELRKLIDYLFMIFMVLIINIFFFALNLKLYQTSLSIIAIGKEGIQLGVGLCKGILEQLFIPQAK